MGLLTTNNHNINRSQYFCNTLIHNWLHPSLVFYLVFLFFTSSSYAQSGDWDASGTTGTTGYTDHGNGVIQLLSTATTGCAGAAVHERTDTYNPVTDGVFSKCYEVYFGCPGDDEVGSDTKGDGLAFSFSDCVWGVGTCGGGLGYRNGCGNMITVEFDTWSSQGLAGFDSNYEGTGNEDQVAIHVDGDPEDFGKIAGANPGNLEDGLEHTVCITYDPGTDVLTVSIDGTDVLTHDLTGSGYELETYFGSVGLYQSWSSGKDGATNPATVSDANQQDISDQVGGPLCDETVSIVNPYDGQVYSACETPITIDAFVVPPSGNTVDSVEFYIGGVRVGVDYTDPYTYDWNDPDVGTSSLVTTAYYDPSMTNSSSSAVDITVGGKIDIANGAPTIDGADESFWDNYAAVPLSQGGMSAPDLAGTYKTAYDATNLYMLIEVTDDDLRDDSGNNWDDDGAEVFIDIGNDKSGAYGANDYQYSFAYNNAPTVTEYKHAATAGVSFAESVVAGGYILEISFPWTTIGGSAPSVNDEIGFDVKLNDDDGGGGRDHEQGWFDGSFGAWNNTSLFGIQEFTDCEPLPVELLNFRGEHVMGFVELDWTTLFEINNYRFIIQRSTNMVHWENIGEVVGAGNSGTPLHYSFADYNAPTGLVYYRLKQLDFDGTSALSEVVVIKDGSDADVTVFPNPFDDVITIQGLYTDAISIQISDVLGRIMYSKRVESIDNSVEINPDLASGTYIIEIQTGTQVLLQQKLIKL